MKITKNSIVIFESFIIVGSFDCHCTLLTFLLKKTHTQMRDTLEKHLVCIGLMWFYVILMWIYGTADHILPPNPSWHFVSMIPFIALFAPKSSKFFACGIYWALHFTPEVAGVTFFAFPWNEEKKLIQFKLRDFVICWK
jgi:hypothetical protein